ncbi:MAG: exodeoxyribonuclease I [Alphaproteobacteria bacterium PA3]|nr:MAG: exodeoxyribonuclease I [Alphaproteobacteria bacterium PA3]
MGFVFYDTETTGIDTSFDQIVQFAAIKTDPDLNIIERFEIRSRLLPFVIPSPKALQVTKIPIERLNDPATPSHYEMVRAITTKITQWAPSIILGYNSLGFDEKLLQKAFYQTLHNPYLTLFHGNSRGDILRLVQAAAELEPGCLNIPTKDDGKPVYKLDRLAPANGFDHSNAHDALSDVEATIHMCRIIRDNAGDIWNRFQRFSRKAAVQDFVGEQEPFLVSENFFGKGKHTPVLLIGQDAKQAGLSLCFDLTQNLNDFRNLTDAQLETKLSGSPKPLKKVKANAAPILTPLDEAPDHVFGSLSLDELVKRAEELRDDEGLRVRIMQAYTATQPNYPPSEHVEKTIYEGFASSADNTLMMRFHQMPWETRYKVCDQFEKQALGFLAKRLIYANDPAFLPSAWRDEIEMHIEERINSVEANPEWTTLNKAHTDCLEMMRDAAPEDIALLTGYLDYLKQRISYS